MNPNLYIYFTKNDEINIKIIPSLNELTEFVSNDETWPVIIHISFDPPLPSKIKLNYLNSQKTVYVSESFVNSNYPDNWKINNNNVYDFGEIRGYPLLKMNEITFSENFENQDERSSKNLKFSDITSEKKNINTQIVRSPEYIGRSELTTKSQLWNFCRVSGGRSVDEIMKHCNINNAQSVRRTISEIKFYPEYRPFVITHRKNESDYNLKYEILREIQIEEEVSYLENENDATIHNNLSQNTDSEKTIFDADLAQFEWSVRTYNVFQSENIQTLSDLIKFNEHELLRIPNFGAKSLREVNQFLYSKNLHLGMMLDDYKIIKEEKSSANTLHDSKTFQDYDLSQFQWTVRTKNVLVSEKIQLLSELVPYDKYELLRLPNFGRNSLKEINEFLSSMNCHLGMFLDEFEILSAYDSENKMIVHQKLSQENSDNVPNSIINNFKFFVSKLKNDQYRDILEKRAGIKNNSVMTLEEVSKDYDVTRERIRQIEKKALNELQTYSIGWNINNYWANKLEEILSKKLYPLSIDEMNSVDEIDDVNNENLDTLKYICFKLDPTFYINNHFGYNFLTKIHDEELDKLIEETHSLLSVSEGQKLQDIEKDLSVSFLPNAKELLKETLNFCLKFSSTGKDIEGDEILTVYSRRRSATTAVIDIFSNSSKPLSNEEIEKIILEKYPEYELRNCINRMQEISGIYPFSHGTWGKLEYLNLDENEIITVNKIISQFIHELTQDQFHSREICDKHLNQLNISDHFKNYFVIAAIIREYFEIPYLGRSVFSNPNSKNTKRIEIHDVIVNILKKFNKPLHASKLLEEANQIRSVDKLHQIHPKPPIKLLGGNVFGLDTWDLDNYDISDLKSRRRLNDDQIETLRSMWLSGQTATEISNVLNCGNQLIYHWVSRLGIQRTKL